MPAWETDGNCSNDMLSREISRRNATRTIRGGEISPLRFAAVEMTGMGAGFFKICVP